MNEKEVEALLRETKAILEGHFLLTSGLHSSLYVEKFNVLQHPKYTRELCKEFAKYFKDKGIETVIGPATGGIILSHVTADLLGVRAIFTERENGKMKFRRGFKIKPGEKVLIVEDIVTQRILEVEIEGEALPRKRGVEVAVKVGIGIANHHTVGFVDPAISVLVDKVNITCAEVA